MRQKAEIDTDRNVLKRIVAMLFALADMADRACGLHCDERRYLVDIFLVAEVTGRDLVIGMATDPGALLRQTYDEMPTTDSDADLRQLAFSLRVLGFLLAHMLLQSWRFIGAARLRSVVIAKVANCRCAATLMFSGETPPRTTSKSHAWSS